MGYKNPVDDIAASRAYYAAHREALCVQQRARYQRNKVAYQAAKQKHNQDPLVREQRRARDRARYAANPLRMRIDQLRLKYGLSWNDYLELIEKQSGRCAVCTRVPSGTKKKHVTLHVDHDHATGHIRGLLCDTCNRGMGLLGDDATMLRRAAEYLDSHAAYRHSA